MRAPANTVLGIWIVMNNDGKCYYVIQTPGAKFEGPEEGCPSARCALQEAAMAYLSYTLDNE